jgi:seryl-tRNA synthetase
MSTWLDSIMSPLNAAGQGIEKLIETRDFIKFGDELRKLHAEILAAQRGAMTAQANEATLLEEVRTLKKKVTDLEAWETEKERYELVALSPNVMAYSIKAAARGSEPVHYICANCYQIGRKSFLNQYSRRLS